MRCIRGLGLALALVALSCSGDFDLTRSTPPRGSLGRELYSLVCDRVGAQALREDVTGETYHAVCHPDPTTGAYADKVDVSKLVALDPAAVNVDGQPVSMEQQQKNRDYRVSRIEALGKRREELVTAFDASFPDIQIAVKDIANADPSKSCGAPQGDSKTSGEDALRHQLAETLGRLTDLYNDRTIPLLTESFANVLNAVRVSPDTQDALARIDARQGYRPNIVAMGVPRPTLSYPRLVDLANVLLKLIATDSDPYNPAGKIDPSKPLTADNRTPIPGKAAPEFQQLLRVLHEELRTATASDPLSRLVLTTDANDTDRKIPSRARGTLELTRNILFDEQDAYGDGRPARYFVYRDYRGVAAMPNGVVAPPFVDLVGPNNVPGPDGYPDLDPLGRFKTATGALPTSPFFSVDGTDGSRTGDGLAGTGATPIYQYGNTTRTFLASVIRDVQPLLTPDPTTKKEAVMNLVGGMPILFGSRDVNASASKSYAPDPSLVAAYKLMHKDPPADLGQTPVVVPYRAFHAEESPLVDLVYAVGQILADPTTDDTLALFRSILLNHSKELARLIGVGLQIKAIADRHPEAHIPAQSTLWDELLDVFAEMAHVKDSVGNGGILEDLISAFGTDQTLAVKDAFTAYIDYKDEITYDPHNLNGPAFNLTTGAVTPMQTPVDRTLPDSGDNKSALQRFMQLLHDANGLAACTKDGAVAHVNIVWNGIPVKLDYPTDVLAKAACTFLGSTAPAKLPVCGVLRFENVAGLLLDVALDRAQLDIRDDCLKKLVANQTLTGLVGGADAFLEEISGVTGFNLYHPTVNGVSRMVYYDLPHDNDPGDPSNPKTLNFFKDVLDPVPSMVCNAAPYVDPSDGKTINLRTCSSFDDTLRGRDNNALFPLEQLDFIKNVRPLAAAFADHQKPLYFVDLFDTLHRHWGSPAQTSKECDPSLPKTNARWCSQDGAVTYEPILSEALKTDLFQALHDFIPILQQTTIQHCTSQDPKTHVCNAPPVAMNGVSVLAEAVRALVDPARAQALGLRDRQGRVTAARNDGTSNPQTTPIYLLIDALKGIDRAFDDDASAHGGSQARHDGWRAARSQLVDTFFSINGTGASSEWANPSIQKVLPLLLDTVRQQVTANCPSARIDGSCTWSRQDLVTNVSDTVNGPTFAAVIDFVDALRSDDGARGELERLLQYLLASADGDAQQATVTAAHDILQLLEDDSNLTPLLHAVAEATGQTLVDDTGKVVRRSVLDALIELLSRVLAKADDGKGNEICADEIDPNRALANVLGKLVTPMGENQPAPIEVMIDVVADVNRAHPGVADKLDGGDYANIANEVSDFCTNEERGLEQVYEVIREATQN